MNIHNIMESIVLDTVNEIFEDKRKEGFEMADCLQCRLDVACYVLNRIKPEYIISGRGLLHFEENYHELIQTKVDMVTLINAGISITAVLGAPSVAAKRVKDITTKEYYKDVLPSVLRVYGLKESDIETLVKDFSTEARKYAK